MKLNFLNFTKVKQGETVAEALNSTPSGFTKTVMKMQGGIMDKAKRGDGKNEAIKAKARVMEEKGEEKEEEEFEKKKEGAMCEMKENMKKALMKEIKEELIKDLKNTMDLSPL